MLNLRQSSVKREQKTALFLREISKIIQELSLDEPDVAKVFVTNIKMSKDYGICFVHFSTFTDKKDFDIALEKLILYKPSIRKALAKSIGGRYASNLVFLYDLAKEKERTLNNIFDKIAQEEEKHN